MKKSIFSWTVYLFAALAMTLSLTACGDSGDNNDEPMPDSSLVAKVVVTYDVSLAQTWYDYYDVQLTYADIAGNEKTQSIEMDWSYSETLQGVETPAVYTCRVAAMPKTTADVPDLDATYPMALDIQCSVRGYTADGTLLPLSVFGKSDQHHSGAVMLGRVLLQSLDDEFQLVNFQYIPE